MLLERIAFRGRNLLSAVIGFALLAAVGPASAEVISASVRVNGIERHFDAHIPDNISRRDEVSVIFGFHGGTSSKELFASYSRLHRAPGARDFIIVYPQGYESTWNAGDCCGKAKRYRIDDVAFVREMLAYLGRLAPVSKDKNFVVGFSNGGGMAQRVACEMADTFAAVASVSGTRDMTDCRPSRPIAVLAMHGLVDDFSPFEGGYNRYRIYRPGMMHVVDKWNERMRCRRTKPITLLDGHVDCNNYLGCRQRKMLVSCAIPDLGHVWPGLNYNDRLEAFWGPSRDELPGTLTIMEFFRMLL